MTQEAFESDEYPFRVRSNQNSPLSSQDWILDNVQRSENGALIAKIGDDHVVTVSFDAVGDGVPDSNKKARRHELLLRHRVSDAAILCLLKISCGTPLVAMMKASYPRLSDHLPVI